MEHSEYAVWYEQVCGSQHRWMSDPIIRANGQGALFFKGGEDGHYICIDKEGNVQAGEYADAYPCITDAIFKVQIRQQYATFDEAMSAVLSAGGIALTAALLG